MTALGQVLTERHAMGERQRKFRAEYQAQIHPLYSGPLHIGVIYVVGIAVIGWCVSHLQGATWASTSRARSSAKRSPRSAPTSWRCRRS